MTRPVDEPAPPAGPSRPPDNLVSLVPCNTMAAPIDRFNVLDTYGLDYHDQPAQELQADQGIRVSDRYVDTHDPLRATTVVDSRTAAVELGVDPGTFFCGAQLAELIQLRLRPGFDHVRAGFIHVPPDQATGARARSKLQLHARETNLAMIAQVVSVALQLAARPDEVLVLTGFGPFAGVADNPTHAFLRDRQCLCRAMALAYPGARLTSTRDLEPTSGLQMAVHEYELPSHRRLRLFTAVLELASTTQLALEGSYFAPEMVADNFAKVVEIVCAQHLTPAAVISLGVDSSQSNGTRTPRFRVETQTRGWRQADSRGCPPKFVRDLNLAEVYMAARARRAPPLVYSQ